MCSHFQMLSVVASGAIALISVATHAATITSFDVPGASVTQGISINGKGTVVGNFTDDTGFGHGFLRNAKGKITFFDPPGARSTGPTAINDAGQVTGGFQDDDQAFHAFLRASDGTFTITDPPRNGTFISPRSINKRGVTAGFYNSGGLHGFVLKPGGKVKSFDAPGAFSLTQAMGINNKRVVAGNFDTDGGVLHAFVRDRHGNFTTFDAPGAVNTTVAGINAQGLVAGSFSTADNHGHGFIRDTQGGFTIVDVGGTITTIRSINSAGAITGVFLDPASHGFVRAAGGQIDTFDPQGSISTTSASINRDGAVTGLYTDSNGAIHGFVRTP